MRTFDDEIDGEVGSRALDGVLERSEARRHRPPAARRHRRGRQASDSGLRVERVRPPRSRPRAAPVRGSLRRSLPRQSRGPGSRRAQTRAAAADLRIAETSSSPTACTSSTRPRRTSRSERAAASASAVRIRGSSTSSRRPDDVAAERAPQDAELAAQARKLADQKPAGERLSTLWNRQRRDTERNLEGLANLVDGPVDERREDRRAAAIDREIVETEKHARDRVVERAREHSLPHPPSRS